MAPDHHFSCAIIEGMMIDDLDRAALNRDMVANKRNTEGYIEVERAVTGSPSDKPLPSWIPQGTLPYLSWRDLVGARQEMRIIIDGE